MAQISKRSLAAQAWFKNRMKLILLIAFLVAISFSVLYQGVVPLNTAALADGLLAFDAETSSGGGVGIGSSYTPTTSSTKDSKSGHALAGLSCGKYGGPADTIAAEMVYWSDIPSDAKFVSPYKKAGPADKYLTFEPDEGGWNNIRMSMETAVAMAYVMGRTLVLPPAQGMYLLDKGKEGQKNKFSFADFFHFESLASEHAGIIDIITFKKFLEREGMAGKLRDKATGQVMFPIDNRTDYDGMERHGNQKKDLKTWMRSVTTNPIWDFDKCVVVFPAEPGKEAATKLNETLMQVWDNVPQEERISSYNGKPTPVDAPPLQRLREMIAHRRNLCMYDNEMQNAKVFHLMGDNDSGARLLVHFYAFLFFENWKHDLWTKRFVRDHLRYVDEIQCAAARVVHAIRQKSRENGNGGVYDSFHIRRGDFQYKDTRVEADVIFKNTQDVLEFNSTLYIATDERDKKFFDIFKQHYHVYFLDDFTEALQDVNTNFYGMLDQRIASRARTFVGTYYSTFTGYINRMRGYHSQLDKAEGYETGKIYSFYYIPERHKYDVREYQSILPPMWAREFPVGWRDLERGM